MLGSIFPSPAQRTFHSLEGASEHPKKVFQLKLVQERPEPEEWKQVSEFRNLNKLYLEDNLLDTLPKAMGALIRMSDFRSHRNPITYFPDTLKRWKALTYFELVGAKLDTFPKICRYWRNLREVGINKNRAERMVLPEAVGNLKDLRLLAINESPLAPLPSGITELPELRKLILKGTELKSFPKKIGDLQKLETLVLEDNELEGIPRSIGELRDLEYLSLKGNLLESLPQTIAACSSLKRLDIRDNYFSEYQLDILKILLPDTEILHDPLKEEEKEP
jgi:leucine-rich repeat protein SHOC2